VGTLVDLFGYHLPGLVGIGAAFAAVYGAFAKFDGDQSDENRKFVRDWLAGINVDERRWNKVVEEIFIKFFGSRHWSWKCLRRSFALSAGLIIAVWLFWEVRWGNPFGWRPGVLEMAIFLSFLSAAVGDFLSLWKTRYLLTRVGSFSSRFAIVTTVAGDFIATTVIFLALYFAFLFAYILVTDFDMCFRSADHASDCGFEYFGEIDKSLIAKSAWQGVINDFSSPKSFPMPFLYSVALLTSAWLWVYLIVAYGMRALSQLPSWLNLLSKVTDFENHPVRSIGYVAAGVSALIVAIATLV
jgi:hypothetical protein